MPSMHFYLNSAELGALTKTYSYTSTIVHCTISLLPTIIISTDLFIFYIITMFLVCPEMFDLMRTKHQLIKPWWEMTWGFWYFLINQIQAVKRKRCTKIIKIIYRVKTSDFNLTKTNLWTLTGCDLFKWSDTWLWLVVGGGVFICMEYEVWSVLN